MPNVSDAATTEATARRNGLNLAAHVGCSKVEAESDCDLVIEVVKASFFGAQVATIVECLQLAS